MNREDQDTATVLVPGVVSLVASSRRTLKHGDSFALFDEFGDVVDVELSPAGLFHHDTRYLSRLHFALEGHRPLMARSRSAAKSPESYLLSTGVWCGISDGWMKLRRRISSGARPSSCAATSTVRSRR